MVTCIKVAIQTSSGSASFPGQTPEKLGLGTCPSRKNFFEPVSSAVITKRTVMLNLADRVPCIPNLSIEDITCATPDEDPRQYEIAFNFILKHGRHFKPSALPPNISHGPKRDCLANSANLAIYDPKFIYVEGIGRLFCGHRFVPFFHAWCCDQEGNVCDRTWTAPNNSGVEYFGVPFRTDFLRDWTKTNICQLIQPKCLTYIATLPQAQWLHPLF